MGSMALAFCEKIFPFSTEYAAQLKVSNAANMTIGEDEMFIAAP